FNQNGLDVGTCASQPVLLYCRVRARRAFVNQLDLVLTSCKRIRSPRFGQNIIKSEIDCFIGRTQPRFIYSSKLLVCCHGGRKHNCAYRRILVSTELHVLALRVLSENSNCIEQRKAHSLRRRVGESKLYIELRSADGDEPF